MRYLICKGLMTMEEVEPWLEALYKIGPIPAPELKALSLLASALRSCPNWVIKTDMAGQHPQVRLLHHYSEDTTFILDITQMIKESGWKKDIHRPEDGSWSEYIYRKNDNIRFCRGNFISDPCWHALARVLWRINRYFLDTGN